MPFIAPPPAPFSGSAGFGTIASGRWRQLGVVRFGGCPVPVMGGALPLIDLNDGSSWITKDVVPQRGNRSLTTAQQAWRNKARYLSDDFGAATIKVAFQYDEQPTGVGLEAAIAPLLNSGEQWLTFDDITAVKVRTKNVTSSRVVTAAPYFHEGELEFLAVEPWFQEMAQTQSNGNGLSGNTVTVAANYLGSWYAEPVIVVNKAASDTSVLNSVTVSNVTSGEGVSVTLSPTAAGGATITVDSSTLSAGDADGNSFDFTGAFPMVYPFPGAYINPNTLVVQVGVASGTPSGVTVDVRYTTRWVL